MMTTQQGSLATAGVDAATRTARVTPSAAQRLLSLQRRFPLVQILLTVAVFGWGAASMPGFLEPTSIRSILVLCALTGLASIGQTLVVLIRGIDLSLAGFIVVGAVAVTRFSDVPGVPVLVTLTIAVACGATMGGLVGYACHRFGIHPIIVTLAAGSIAVGASAVLSGGGYGGGAPGWVTRLSSPMSSTLGIPVPPVVIVWAVAIAVVSVLLHRTLPGRRLLATGASPVAADLAHISTRKVWITVYAISAALAVLAGVVLAGFAGNVDSRLGNPYLFQSIAAVVLGGTAFGGPGSYTRTTAGVLLLTVVSTVLVGLGFGEADQQILNGVVIVAAMAVYGRERRLRDQV
ncbi:ribose transport system permease protein [Kribbella steppae]|uniref:Ribose transport system permease protein n=1 Tax=Kribbella steppae TaxID=2512223 RepID=A0A4R2HFP2_9ACTN|nr:ABC transporter permease [Kribbella steppae]TCO28061.1 ribose transport system permease protein [Kribbella steppae]